MKNRIETPFTSEHFAGFCLSMVGQPYWYGTTGSRATESLLKRKTAQYPSHYPSSRSARYRKDIEKRAIVCDCIGGCKAYAWTGGGESLLKALSSGESYSSKYGANGCPDKSANGMFSYAKQKGMPWGEISSLPDLPGIALWKDGHVGYTVGNGMAVEWRSFSYGCVKTKISARNWKSWYLLPFIDYGEDADFTRSLKRGMTGADVKKMQTLLMQAGYALPLYGADGDFGKETEEALKHFQADNGLRNDGVYSEASRRALTGLSEETTPGENSEEETQTEAPDTKKKVVIRSNGGNVNIRLGNGTEFEKVFSSPNGASFPYVATAENGWHAIRSGKAVYWVSGQYGFCE